MGKLPDYIFNGRVNPPCNDCRSMFAGCQALCDQYQEYKKAHEAEKQAIKSELSKYD